MSLTPPEPYSTYVLECKTANSIETVESRSIAIYGYVPDFAYAAHNSWTRYYVGATSDIETRILNHIDPETHAADFTEIFPPDSLFDVRWVASYSDATSLEDELYLKMMQEEPDAFVWKK